MARQKFKAASFLTPGYSPELAVQIRRSREGQAHFAGTGPFGATCSECAFLGYWKQIRNASGDTVKSQRVGGCEKFRQLTGKHGPVVPPDTEACRYFQRREGM
jgi:hypothetical protein